MSKTPSKIDIASSEQLIAIVKRVNQLVLTLTPEAVIPRTSPVFYALDADTSTAYWLSNSEATHSQNISENPNVSVTFIANAIDGYKPASIMDEGLDGVAKKVTATDELEHAYSLLKSKALKLPENLEDFSNKNALRHIYGVRVKPNEMRGNNDLLADSKYMVLGTSPRGQEPTSTPKTIALPFEGTDGTTIRVKLNGKDLTQYADDTHVCIFDSNVRQGDGVGIYFNASVVAEKDSDIAELKIKTDEAGNPVLSTNGLIEFDDIRGWVDAQRSIASNVLDRAFH